uniref:(northern house mosquito) hypothetical protein n=1 Tax=Culex pipiens TaxID=7175 RepID=A0A8D8G7J7_CULPI
MPRQKCRLIDRINTARTVGSALTRFSTDFRSVSSLTVNTSFSLVSLWHNVISAWFPHSRQVSSVSFSSASLLWKDSSLAAGPSPFSSIRTVAVEIVAGGDDDDVAASSDLGFGEGLDFFSGGVEVAVASGSSWSFLELSTLLSLPFMLATSEESSLTWVCLLGDCLSVGLMNSKFSADESWPEGGAPCSTLSRRGLAVLE